MRIMKVNVSTSFGQTTLTLSTDNPIEAAENIGAIKEAILNNRIFYNDLNCYHWQFDSKLPCGKWLENVRLSNDFKNISATVLFN